MNNLKTIKIMSHGNMAEEPTQAELDQEYLRIRQQEEQQQIEYNNIQNKTDMNTGTYSAKVAQVVHVKPWGEGTKKTFYHDLVMDNGHKIHIGKKKTLTEGDALNYEVVEVGQQEFNKCKPWNPDFNNSGNSQQAPPQKRSYPTEKEKFPSFSLSYAKDQIITFGLPTGIEPTVENIAAATHALAEKHLEWLNSH